MGKNIVICIYCTYLKKKKPSGALPSGGYFLGMNLYLFSPTSEQVCKKGQGATSVHCRPLGGGGGGGGGGLFPGTELVPLFYLRAGL